jgi:hypothetical protein
MLKQWYGVMPFHGNRLSMATVNPYENGLMTAAPANSTPPRHRDATWIYPKRIGNYRGIETTKEAGFDRPIK